MTGSFYVILNSIFSDELTVRHYILISSLEITKQLIWAKIKFPNNFSVDPHKPNFIKALTNFGDETFRLIDRHVLSLMR
jgi:hypothetical protein